MPRPIPAHIRDHISYDPFSGQFTWLRPLAAQIRPGSMAGSINGDGYLSITFDGQKYQGHRLAWFLHFGVDPESDVDHVNMDRADNRIENLRLASPSQNMWNTKARTAYGKGVHFHRQSRKFVAQIRIHGRQTHLGLFPTAEEAREAYQAAAAKHHGAFARFD